MWNEWNLWELLLNKEKSVKYITHTFVHCLWFIHTGCLRDRDRDVNEWFYVEPFTLHLNRDREEWAMYPFDRSWNCFRHCVLIILQWLSCVQCPILVPDTANVNVLCIISVPVQIPVPVPDTASVIRQLWLIQTELMWDWDRDWDRHWYNAKV